MNINSTQKSFFRLFGRDSHSLKDFAAKLDESLGIEDGVLRWYALAFVHDAFVPLLTFFSDVPSLKIVNDSEKINLSFLLNIVVIH